MVVKSYESKSTVDRLKELEKIVFKTHSPLSVREVMKNVEEYENIFYNQALEDMRKTILTDKELQFAPYSQDMWFKNRIMDIVERLKRR